MLGAPGAPVRYEGRSRIGCGEAQNRPGGARLRAEDVLAAVEYVRSLPGIDRDRIGIAGHSQGGWVVQSAGSTDPTLAFVVSFAGPVVTVEEQDLRRVRISLECSGASPEEVERGVTKRARALDRMRRVGRWFPFFQLGLMSNLLSYDPEPALRDLRVPTLLAFGELDDQAVPGDSLEELNRIFGGSIPENITIHVEPEADHYFRQAETRCFNWEAALGNPYRESFQRDLGEWVDEVLN